MGTPGEHLPPPLSETSIQRLMDSIGLPVPIAVVSPKVAAEYHSIYIISFSSNAIAPFIPKAGGDSGQTDLILRVSGPHLPELKTTNEVAVISWIVTNTTIPIASVIRHDSSINNSIGHEYILLEKIQGQSLDEVFPLLDKERVSNLIDQFVDIHTQLHLHEWTQIGGLQFTESGDIVPGPVLEETFWQVPDITRYWSSQETVQTLNIGGPFDSYVDYISAHVRKYIYAIKLHDSLAFMRDILPRVENFVDALTKDAAELNKVKLRLAHKDLHFANVLYDLRSGKITAVIDWEFAGVVPFTRWNPTRAFLGYPQWTEEGAKERDALMKLFIDRCVERGIDIPQDAAFSSPKQEAMQKAANFLRAVVEVSPRGQKQQVVGTWRESFL